MDLDEALRAVDENLRKLNDRDYKEEPHLTAREMEGLLKFLDESANDMGVKLPSEKRVLSQKEVDSLFNKEKSLKKLNELFRGLTLSADETRTCVSGYHVDDFDIAYKDLLRSLNKVIEYVGE